MSVAEVLERTGPRKLLALDGGGILGLVSLGYLARIEQLLRDRLGAGDAFVLADYFDAVAGSGSGAITAAGLAAGRKVEDLRQLFVRHGREMFEAAWLLQQAQNNSGAESLAVALRGVFGETTLNAGPDFKALLMMTLRDAQADAPVLVSNFAPGPIPSYPLWRLARASTWAPRYLGPESIAVGEDRVAFKDGGATVVNNPAFALFSAAATGVGWSTGEANLLLVSIGTGGAADANPWVATEAVPSSPSLSAALLASAEAQQDALCRCFGKAAAAPASASFHPRMFTYVRYNADLARSGLDALNLQGVAAELVRRMDSVDSIHELDLIGQTAAERQVESAHFDGFV